MSQIVVAGLVFFFFQRLRENPCQASPHSWMAAGPGIVWFVEKTYECIPKWPFPLTSKGQCHKIWSPP